MKSELPESLFGETFRPQSHFTPARNWMNDPNGLVFHNGKYHLFYQHNPQGNIWGNMSWGHATSTDLFQWEHLPVAITFDETFGIFSGSAVVDYKNSSGFGSLANPPMVAIYTAHHHDKSGQSQHIAYSLDEGLTWVKYEGNPVLDLGMKDFRDPKVSYETATDTWLMTVAKPEEFKISFFRSSDLKSWHHLSDFGPLGATGGCWECPDLITLSDENGESKWVLLISLNPGGYSGGSGTQYFIGHWDGTNFVADSDEVRWIDYGRDNYAGVTFHNTPDNEKIFIGWMNNWIYADKYPTELWRSSMTVPRRLSLESVTGKTTLISRPLTPPLPTLIKKYLIDTKKDFAATFSNKENNFSVRFHAATQRFEITRSWFIDDAPQISPAISADQIEVQLIIDNGSCELFAPAAGVAMTSLTLVALDGIAESTPV
jgi:sucrose-6-phosphate hydrolase SacC (GH32 family)